MCSVNLLWPTIYMFFYSIYMSSSRHAFVFGSFQLCVYGLVLEDLCFSIQNQNLTLSRFHGGCLRSLILILDTWDLEFLLFFFQVRLDSRIFPRSQILKRNAESR